ncbi:DUF4376 domain-containing protein [Leminorella grimontii]|uniref:DUF4376 domain-containing protein n=1 Tax=Leminorella grimontii TaxID=82981 RepID=UPI00208B16AD|nr:DUF4376 domain-containing protein [Leminorella grimontii]GKX61405.1 hypothetical protein SOASR031_37200 [Leminorella grimontii]
MYYYSPSENMFYPEALKSNYLNTGSFPTDAIEVSDDIYIEFVATEPPAGKVRQAGNDGAPMWADMLICIDDAKSKKIADIKAHRDAMTVDYIIIDGHHFHSDVNSRIQQLSLTKMGQAGQIPSGMMWQTKNHGLIELTNEIAALFETETLAHDMHLFTTAQQHIAAVEALEDVQAVINYDYSEGWQL